MLHVDPLRKPYRKSTSFRLDLESRRKPQIYVALESINMKCPGYYYRYLWYYYSYIEEIHYKPNWLLLYYTIYSCIVLYSIMLYLPNHENSPSYERLTLSLAIV